MISRRTVLIGSAAAAVTAFARRATPALAKAPQPVTPVRFDVPPGACDCHTHVFDPERFPFASERNYTPEPVLVDELRALHRALQVDRVVLVTATVYGADNRCTLEALKQLGTRARGIAVIDAATPDAALDEMDRDGVRGIRLNLGTSGQADAAVSRQRFQAAVERLTGRTWHIQINTLLATIDAIKADVSAAPVPVVFDHFGGAQASLGVQQAGFDVLLNLVRAGHAYVKISAPYRSSEQVPEYADIAPLAKALIAANPQRILWGTDWPHPNGPQVVPTPISQFWQIDDGRVFNQLAMWAPDAAQRKTILVENPARLYGF